MNVSLGTGFGRAQGWNAAVHCFVFTLLAPHSGAMFLPGSPLEPARAVMSTRHEPSSAMNDLCTNSTNSVFSSRADLRGKSKCRSQAAQQLSGYDDDSVFRADRRGKCRSAGRSAAQRPTSHSARRARAAPPARLKAPPGALLAGSVG